VRAGRRRARARTDSASTWFVRSVPTRSRSSDPTRCSGVAAECSELLRARGWPEDKHFARWVAAVLRRRSRRQDNRPRSPRTHHAAPHRHLRGRAPSRGPTVVPRASSRRRTRLHDHRAQQPRASLRAQAHAPLPGAARVVVGAAGDVARGPGAAEPHDPLYRTRSAPPARWVNVPFRAGDPGARWMVDTS
jgi:hypothetical protein